MSPFARLPPRSPLPLLIGGALCCGVLAAWPARETPGGGGRDPTAPDGAGSSGSRLGAGPPRLCLEPERLDLGRLEPGEGREVEVAWRREGTGSLRVHGLVTGCACAATRGLAVGRLEEAAEGTLGLVLAPLEREGPFTVRVRVHTDGAPATATLVVHGHVGAALAARPAALDLGRRTAGTECERLVDVRLARDLLAQTPEATLEGLEGSVEVGEPVVRGEPGLALRIRLRIPCAEGPFRGTALLRMGRRAILRVPVRGLAVGPAPHARLGDRVR